MEFLRELSSFEFLTLLCIFFSFAMVVFSVIWPELGIVCVLGICLIWGRWYMNVYLIHEGIENAKEAEVFNQTD